MYWMQIKYKNLKFKFKYEHFLEDFIGESVLTLTEAQVIQFVEACSDYEFDLDSDYNDLNYIKDGIEYGAEELMEFANQPEETFEAYNTDLQILLFNFFLDEEGKEFEFKYIATNPYWLLHDLCHAEKDVASGTIYIDGWIENQRLLDGIYLAKELDMLRHVNLDMLEAIHTSFNERWKINDIKFDIETAVTFLNDSYNDI